MPTSMESVNTKMEGWKKMENRDCGEREHLVFRGEAYFVTETQIICFRGPQEEEGIILIVKNHMEKDIYYRIGKNMKLGLLMNDYCDRRKENGFDFIFDWKRLNMDDTPKGLDMQQFDVIDIDTFEIPA